MNLRSLFAASLALTLASACLAQDTKPLLHDHVLPVLATPDFKTPLDSSFSIAKGKWRPEDG
ncbi:MAG: hypothetical protein NTY98_11345, partial [Verrucomicrobia bacterium]|nr:hypothetical protein [Verrucomicrobiota bacterium]